MTLIFNILFISSISYADTCYDPNYDRYYYCQGDEYVAPVAAALLFGALLLNDRNDDNRHHHRNDYRYGYGHNHGSHRGHDHRRYR
jgi:hypothetical protein